ncbi:methyl-accepting chemotaxis protein, partial [Escherichia coli]|nr:methyl-accepting chemotaxis protein [Escherichia coli]
TLSRHVESANQQSLVPVYTLSPVEDFAKVGESALEAASTSLAQLVKGLAPLGLPRTVIEQPGTELARYRATLDQYRQVAVKAEQLQNTMERRGDELRSVSLELGKRKVEQRDREALA